MANPIINFVESVCIQPAWYWADATGTPDGFGGTTYTTPILVYVRWDGKSQLVIGRDGKEVVSNGEILVMQDMAVGGRIKITSDTETIPTSTEGSDLIITKQVTPLFRSMDEFVYTVFV